MSVGVHVRAASILLTIFIVSSTISLPSAGRLAEDQELALFISSSDERVQLGSEVLVMVHAFQGAEYFDPDNISLVAKIGYSEVIHLSLTRESEGVYSASFIASEDLLYKSLKFYLEALAWIADPNGGSVRDSHEIYLLENYGMRADIVLTDADDKHPGPGDLIEFDVFFTFLDEPVDPEESTDMCNVWSKEQSIGNESFERVGIGHYVGEFQVYDTFRGSDVVGISTIGQIYRDNRTYTGRDTELFYINAYHVWIHLVDISSANLTLDIYVTTVRGEIVEGAILNMTLTSRFNGGINWTYVDDVTDEEGRARARVELPSEELNYLYIDIEASVEKEGVEQDVSKEIFLKEDMHWFDIPLDSIFIELENELPLLSDKEVVLNYTAFLMGEPFPNEQVHYYLTNGRDLLVVGTAVTDDNGRFQIGIRTPQIMSTENVVDAFEVYFHAYDSELYTVFDWIWYGTGGIVGENIAFFDKDLDINVGDTLRGRVVNVTMDHPDADGEDEWGVILWGIGPPNLTHSFSPFIYKFPGWGAMNRWDEYDGDYFSVSQGCVWENGSYSTSFILPSFIPKGTELHVVGFIEFQGPGPSERIGNVVTGLQATGDVPVVKDDDPVVKDDDPVDKDNDPVDPSDGPWYSGAAVWLLIIIVIIACSLSFIIVRGRRQ
jgi:hypothetical protein